MSAYLHSLCFGRCTLACALAAPASAQTVARKDLSVDGAVTIATTAMADCKAKGCKVSATVVGRTGEVLVQLRGDGTGPHTMENSFKKAFTARTFSIPSGDMEKRLKDNPQMGAQYLTGFTTGARRAADQDRRRGGRRRRRLRRAGRREGRGLRADRAR